MVLIAVITVISPPAWSEISNGESAVEAALAIGEAVVATGVENLKPVGPGDAFPRTVGRLYCFTRIKGAAQNTTIKHLWFKGDTLVMEITLPIQSADWRTYSIKTITPASAGSWRVDITTESGTVLRSVPFTIE
jgi:hypothetical protein